MAATSRRRLRGQQPKTAAEVDRDERERETTDSRLRALENRMTRVETILWIVGVLTAMLFAAVTRMCDIPWPAPGSD